MSLINLKDLPKDLINLLPHALMLPYWYISIYIFYPELYASNDIFLIISLTISLTISSAAITTTIFLNVSPTKDEMLSKKTVYPTIYFEIILFSIILILSYIFKVLVNCFFEFYGFVLAITIPKLFLLYKLNKKLIFGSQHAKDFKIEKK